ncbi:MAG TPA: transposase [Acetobacteraceae bacterium]
MSRRMPIPQVAEPLVSDIRDSHVFTRPTFERFVVLMCGLIVTAGRRSVSRALQVMKPMLGGHWSDYHRLFSSARYSAWALAAVLVRQVVALLPANEPLVLLADDTVHGKNGPHVWARGAHRDPVRSSRKKSHVKFGHKWLVMAVLARLPGLARPWALPVLCGLCLSPKVAQPIKRRPKTASALARQLLIRLMRWLPTRSFIFVGDYQVATHEVCRFAQRHGGRVTVIGRLRCDANLYAPPKNPNRKTRGGTTARKGSKLPSPAERAAQLTPVSKEVCWYGGRRKLVRFVSETALWYDKHGGAVMPIRWVCVLGDAKEGLEDAYFYSSDPQMAPERVIELYASRWNIEVTFEESRALLGLQTTRHWCRRSVLRVTPMLLGLFTAVALLWSKLPACKRRRRDSATPCYEKQAPTFADVLFTVRREIWRHSLLVRHRGKQRCLDVLPRPLRQTLLWHLAAAA